VNSNPKSVTPSIPKNTAVPSAWRISAPAPVANTKGTTPRMKAKEVMRIGRRRVRAACAAASKRSAPCSSACLANSVFDLLVGAGRFELPTPSPPAPRSALILDRLRCQAVSLGGERIIRRASVQSLQADYHVSPNGLTSTLNDHAERGWFATCQASSAIAAGAIKKSSGLSLKRWRAQGTSITASITM